VSEETKRKGRKAGSKIAPEGETKQDRFKRLAQHRMTNLLNRMRGIVNLSSSNYDYTEEYATQILNAIKNSVEEIEAALMRRFNATEVSKEGFKLS
jgi:signal transduction histidine kinase